MPAIKTAFSGYSVVGMSLNNSGTESNPYSILSVVTDINDANFITRVKNDVYLYRPLSFHDGFLLIDESITVHETGPGWLFNAANNLSSTLPILSGAGAATAHGGGSVTVTASSQFSDAYAIWRVVGRAGEFATSAQQAGWWVLAQYSNPVIPNSITLADRPGNVEYMTAWKVQGSNDGANWTTLYTGSARPSVNPTIFTFANTTAYSHVRLYVDSAVGPNPGLGYFQIGGAGLAPTNGIELRGSARIVHTGNYDNNAGAGSLIQGGTGVYKCTEKNGVFPTYIQRSGYRWDTFFSANGQLGAAAIPSIVFKIDGLNVYLHSPAYLKWYTGSLSSYVRNVNVQRSSDYSGANPTAFQLHYGSILSDARSSEFNISGDFPESAKNTLLRPYFDIAAPAPLIGSFWPGTNIDIVDPRFAAGGSWNGLISPEGTGGVVAGMSTIGARIRHKTTYTATVNRGNGFLQNAKFAFVPTRVGASALSESVSGFYALTDASGKISARTLLYKEWFPTANTANQAASTTTTWNIFARHPLYSMTWQLRAGAGAVSMLTDSLAVETRVACTLSALQAEIPSSPYAGVAIDRANKRITLTLARTSQELYNYIQWWLYQDAQMDLADFSTVVAGVLDITDWAIVGAHHLSGSIKTAGAITATGAMGNLSVQGSVTQLAPTNIANVKITGTLTYNTAAATTIEYTNCQIGVVANNGTGLVTIVQSGSTVTNYSDPEINYLDSFASFAGCDATDTVFVRRVDTNAVLYTHPASKGALFRFKAASYIGVVVFFERVNSVGGVVASTYTTQTQELVIGDNGSYELTSPADIPSLAQTRAYMETFVGQLVWTYKTAADRVATAGAVDTSGIVDEIERAGGKLDKAMKAAQSAEDNTI